MFLWLGGSPQQHFLVTRRDDFEAGSGPILCWMKDHPYYDFSTSKLSAANDPTKGYWVNMSRSNSIVLSMIYTTWWDKLGTYQKMKSLSLSSCGWMQWSRSMINDLLPCEDFHEQEILSWEISRQVTVIPNPNKGNLIFCLTKLPFEVAWAKVAPICPEVPLQ